MVSELHFKEDTTKPENRVNISLFHLLMIDEVFDFIKQKFELPNGVFVYPCPKLEVEEFNSSERPDFKITDGINTIGFIEVELGRENKGQLQSYRTKQGKPVYSIVGKSSYGEGNIALDEILHLTNSIKDRYANTQKSWSIKLFEQLINYYVVEDNYNDANKRSRLSPKMVGSKLITYIYSYFGEENILECEKVQRGKIMFDTIGEDGFSLRIYSHVPSNKAKGLSLMSRTGGRNFVEFPSDAKLKKYLPHCGQLTDKYADLIYQLGGREIRTIGERKKVSIGLCIVEENISSICEIIKNIIE